MTHGETHAFPQLSPHHFNQMIQFKMLHWQNVKNKTHIKTIQSSPYLSCGKLSQPVKWDRHISIYYHNKLPCIIVVGARESLTPVFRPVCPPGWLWRAPGVWGGPREVLLGWGSELGCGLCPDQQTWGLLPDYQAPQLDPQPHRPQPSPSPCPLHALHASYDTSAYTQAHGCCLPSPSTW